MIYAEGLRMVERSRESKVDDIVRKSYKKLRR